MSNIASTYQRLRSSQKFQRRFSVAIRLLIAVILIIFSGLWNSGGRVSNAWATCL